MLHVHKTEFQYICPMRVTITLRNNSVRLMSQGIRHSQKPRRLAAGWFFGCAASWFTCGAWPITKLSGIHVASEWLLTYPRVFFFYRLFTQFAVLLPMSRIEDSYTRAKSWESGRPSQQGTWTVAPSHWCCDLVSRFVIFCGSKRCVWFVLLRFVCFLAYGETTNMYVMYPTKKHYECDRHIRKTVFCHIHGNSPNQQSCCLCGFGAKPCTPR